MKALLRKPLKTIFIVGVIHLLSASLSWASNTYSLAWKAGLAGNNAQDDQSSSKYVSFGLDAQMNYWLAPTVFFDVNPLIKFENGSFQSIDGERKNESGIYMREAGANWMFANSSTLAAGALDQTTSHSALLVGDQAFPAVRARWQVLGINSFYTGIEAAQAVPTSTSLSTNTTGVEPTPGFSSASLNFNYQPSPQYYWKNRVGAFRFDNLPTAVAYESSLRGNTTTALTQSEALFTYKYQGFEATSELRFPVMRGWDFYGSASYLKNSQVESNLGEAYAAKAGSEFFFVGRKSLDLSLTGFRIAPDAAVAYFNSNQFFNTNRVGYSIESYVNFKKYNFRLGLGYTEAELIYLNPVQSREKNLMLKLETFYANI
jgi:hypothetical protein